MKALSEKVLGRLHFTLEQVQDLTPTPMTLSSVMFYTGENPYTHEAVYVARTQEEKRRQKSYFFSRQPEGSGRFTHRSAVGAGEEGRQGTGAKSGTGLTTRGTRHRPAGFKTASAHRPEGNRTTSRLRPEGNKASAGRTVKKSK